MTVCSRGHNDWLTGSHGYPQCRTCKNDRRREQRERKKLGLPPLPRSRSDKPCKNGHVNWDRMPGGKRFCVTCKYELTGRKRGLPQGLTDEARFHRKYRVDSATSCWVWQGALSQGYGRFSTRKATVQWRAHRYAWTLYNGPVPEGLVIHHTCHNRACVNPAHLDAVTPAENARYVRPIYITRIQHCATCTCAQRLGDQHGEGEA